MTPWLAAGVVVASICGALHFAISRFTRELTSSRRTLGEFRAGLEPALLRVQTETEAARARLAHKPGA